jgi:hypothetical protein
MFLVCLFLFSTCFGPLCARHQEKQLYPYDTWYLSLCVEWIPPCIPDSHLHRETNTKCRIDRVISPDDGHIVARNMYRKEINIPRTVVHQVGFIYKISDILLTLLNAWRQIFIFAFVQRLSSTQNLQKRDQQFFSFWPIVIWLCQLSHLTAGEYRIEVSSIYSSTYTEVGGFSYVSAAYWRFQSIVYAW